MGAIYLIRHGQASFGASNYDQLSELGHQQARVLGEALLPRIARVDAAVTGTLQRHQATASSCLEAMGLSLAPQVHAGFNEFDHEEVIACAEPRYADRLVMMADMAASGSPRRAFQQFFEQAVRRWMSGAHDADYRETWSAFKLRCHAALDDVIQQAQQHPSSGTTLVFTSGGFIAMACQRLLGIPDEHAFTLNWTLVNGGVTKLVVGSQGPRLVSVNEHAHFEGHHASLLTYR
ncbi:MAG TPA: histidine phosphatase family protein [Aquabacterium sp.]|nr:histidine phosphatase family protein [Aquabacterium sp.]